MERHDTICNQLENQGFYGWFYWDDSDDDDDDDEKGGGRG